jgi:hypothetical protein
MVLYEVTLVLGDPAAAGGLEAFMRGRHIPHIFATGCFTEVRFCRMGPGRYRTVYAAASQEDLDRYVDLHAPGLRADFEAHAPAGLTVTREVWEVVERWG